MLVDEKITKIIGGGFEIAEVKYMDKTVWKPYIPPRIYNITDSTVASKEAVSDGNMYKIKMSIDDAREVMWFSLPVNYQKDTPVDERTKEVGSRTEYGDFSNAFVAFFNNMNYNGRMFARLDKEIWGGPYNYHNVFPVIKNGKDSMGRIIVMQKSTPEKEQEVLKNLKL